LRRDLFGYQYRWDWMNRPYEVSPQTPESVREELPFVYFEQERAAQKGNLNFHGALRPL